MPCFSSAPSPPRKRSHPGYGPSYVVGKSQLDHMIARASHQAEASGKPFNLQQTFASIWASVIVPPSVVDSEFLERRR